MKDENELGSPPARFTVMKFPPLTLLACLVVTALAGCAKCPQPRPPYEGPTEPMADVVAAINHNNASIRSIRALHSYDAQIVDPKGKSHTFSGTGYLLFRKPEDLLLTAKVVTEDAFTVGSNAERYWFTVPRENTMWWGEKANFSAQKARDIPIRPDLLLEVLGILDVETNFKQPPVPVMRFNRDEQAYMFLWAAPLPDRWIALKEVWYDRETKLPRLVNLFDENGRVILRAYLKDHGPIDGADGKIAYRFELFFPETKTRMNFNLDHVTKDYKKGRITIPNDASFAFPEQPGVDKIIEIK
jgi:hypothetical protein